MFLIIEQKFLNPKVELATTPDEQGAHIPNTRGAPPTPVGEALNTVALSIVTEINNDDNWPCASE